MNTEEIEEAAIDIILPVLEASIIYASHYCKTCGRSTVTTMDVQYGLKHAAMTYVGKKLGSHFSSSEEDDEDEDEEEWASIIEDDEEEFTRYEGTEDETCIKMNESFDNWDSWEPFSPAEKYIKNAVEKQQQNGRLHTQ